MLEANNDSQLVSNAVPADQKPAITSFSVLLTDSINDWKKHFKTLVKIYLWGVYYALIPLVIIGLDMILLNFLKEDQWSIVRIILIIISIIAAIIAIYFSVQAYVGILVFIKNGLNGSPKESFKAAKPLIFSYVWLSILTAILVMLWSLLLIIPGIIFSVFYSLAVYAFIFENKRGMDAIKRSKELIKNYWWSVAGRIFGLSFLIWLVTMIISIPGNMSPEGSWFFNFWGVVVQIFSFLIGPIALLFSYKIYRDLINIKK